MLNTRCPETLWGGPLARLLSDELTAPASRWQPHVDVKEDAKSFHILMDLPGVKPEDMKVDVHEQTLSISGQRRTEEGSQAKDYSYRERAYGEFSRTFQLPTTVDTQHVEARFDKGVLTVHLPKLAHSLKRSIPVQEA